jgi:hypothetical protein
MLLMKTQSLGKQQSKLTFCVIRKRPQGGLEIPVAPLDAPQAHDCTGTLHVCHGHNGTFPRFLGHSDRVVTQFNTIGQVLFECICVLNQQFDPGRIIAMDFT